MLHVRSNTATQVLKKFFLKEGSPNVLRFWSLLKGRRPSPHQSEAFLVPRLPRWAQATMPTPHAHVTIGQPSHGHCGRLPSWAFQLSCGTCRTADPGRPSGFCGSHLRSGHSLSGGAASDGGTARLGEPASDRGTARLGELPQMGALLILGSQPQIGVESPSSTHLEALVPSRDSRARTRSPSPHASRPNFPGATQEAP